jgi:CRISPR-associated protein Csm1
MAFDEKEFYAVVLGALLHDIGKVVQRAQDNPTLKKHTEWGYEWLKENLNDSMAVNATIAHHFTKDDDYALTSNIGLIWYHADNLSSAERKGIEKEKLEEGRWHSEVALASPFSRVRNPNNLNETPTLTYLHLIQKGIPRVLNREPVITKDDYKKLLDAFQTDLNDRDVQKPQSIDFLLMLYEKYFSAVPSITMKIYDGLSREEIERKHPDISLYDHSKLTAAIAGCMYRYYSGKYQEKWNRHDLLRNEILEVPLNVCPYLLIGGDISGVQKFIYTIASKGALKSLKGRSFYLELLSEHIISSLLTRLGLTRCNLIFSGGAHFYIISHNTDSSKQSIKKVKEGIDDFLFNEFKGSLQLHLEYVEFHADDFKDISPVWDRLSERLQRSKEMKWQDRLGDILKPEMPHEECLTESCEVCFREDLPLKKLSKGGEMLKVCDPCFSQHQLGEMLTGISKRRFPVLYKLPIEPESPFIKIEDVYYQLRTGWDPVLHQNADAVYRINDLTAKHYSHPRSIFLPLGIYQHEALRELEDASDNFGIKRIVVVRMDVDNLGKIFSKAVPEGDRSFSRMASISRNLNTFFKHYLNDIAEGVEIEDPTDVANRNIKASGRMLSVVYSGGDDLFLIGHWLDITESAFDINRHFQRFTGNSFITISGGIAANHEKYPVYQYARDANRAEDIAKSAGKNTMTLFGHVAFKWDDAEMVLERVKLFLRFLKPNRDHFEIVEGSLPMTFFYRLLALSRRFNEEGVLVLPKAAYLLSRIKVKEINIEDGLKMKEAIMNTNNIEWKITEAAILWTLMLMRKGGE